MRFVSPRHIQPNSLASMASLAGSHLDFAPTWWRSIARPSRCVTLGLPVNVILRMGLGEHIARNGVFANVVELLKNFQKPLYHADYLHCMTLWHITPCCTY